MHETSRPGEDARIGVIGGTPKRSTLMQCHTSKEGTNGYIINVKLWGLGSKEHRGHICTFHARGDPWQCRSRAKNGTPASSGLT
jgi:hypothetical protein